jgi:hypothetical protein
LRHPQNLAVLNVHKGTIDAQWVADEVRAGRKAADSLFSDCQRNARQACSLKTKFPPQQQASRYLRQNWNRIEQMARDCLARECFENGRINLVMI